MSSTDSSNDFYSFLKHIDLDQFYGYFQINDAIDLKLVNDDELLSMGMNLTDVKNLRKAYRQEFSKSTIGKVKKIMKTRSNASDLKSPMMPRATVSQHLIPYSNLTLGKLLGSGSMGRVREAIWLADSDRKLSVAAKTLRGNIAPGDILKEVAFMYRLDHKCIIKFFGVVLNSPDGVMIISELAPMDSLHSCLTNENLRFTFHLLRLCDIIVQICDAMVYLESKGVVHKNLTCRNVLVFTSDKIKICDFGLPRSIGNRELCRGNSLDADISLRLFYGWQAIECLKKPTENNIFTIASDVWAFGTVLWEMFSYCYEQPWANYSSNEIIDQLERGIRLLQPELCTKEYYSVLLKCWDIDPKKRPKFTDLLNSLNQIKPDQVQAIEEFPSTIIPKGYLPYKKGDIITVIEKYCKEAPEIGLWRGVLNSGIQGFFNSTNTTSSIIQQREIVVKKNNTAQRSSSFLSNMSNKMGRKDKKSIKKVITKDMINEPMEVRHLGHIGYSGVAFGNVEEYAQKLEKQYDDSGPNAKSDTVISTMSLEKARRDHGIIDKLDFDLNLDLGPSFMDDVMQTFEKEFETINSPTEISADTNEKITYIERTDPDGIDYEINSSFDNSKNITDNKKEKDAIFNNRDDIIFLENDEYQTSQAFIDEKKGDNINSDSSSEEEEYEINYTDRQNSINNGHGNVVAQLQPTVKTDIGCVFDNFAPNTNNQIYRGTSLDEKPINGENEYENFKSAKPSFSWNVDNNNPSTTSSKSRINTTTNRRGPIECTPPKLPSQKSIEPIDSFASNRHTAATILARPLDFDGKKDDLYETYPVGNDSGYETQKRNSYHSDVTTTSEQSSSDSHSPQLLNEKTFANQRNISSLISSLPTVKKIAPSAAIEDLSDEEIKINTKIDKTSSSNLSSNHTIAPPLSFQSTSQTRDNVAINLSEKPTVITNISTPEPIDRMLEWRKKRREQERMRRESVDSSSNSDQANFRDPLSDLTRHSTTSSYLTNIRKPTIPRGPLLSKYVGSINSESQS